MTHVRSILYAVIDIIWNRNDRTDLLYVNISEFTLVSRHHCVRQSVHTPVLRLFALSSLAPRLGCNQAIVAGGRTLSINLLK